MQYAIAMMAARSFAGPIVCWSPNGKNFLLKLVAVGAILFIYCTLYRQQLQKLWQLGIGLLRKLFSRHA